MKTRFQKEVFNIKKNFARLFAALLAAVLLFTLSASAEVPEGVELAEDQTIHLLLGNNVSTFDFQAVSWTGESEILNYVLEGLFRIEKNEDGKEVPTLIGAESYEVSDDGLTYTFHLRDSVWSDGVPVTAQQYADAQAEAGEITKVAIPRSYVRAAVANQAEDRSPSGLMGNAKIRLALSLAINREEFVETIFGRYEPAYDYVAPVVTVNGVIFNTSGEGTVKELLEEYPDAESLRELFKAGLDELGYEYSDLSDITLVYADTIDSSLDEARIEYLAQNREDVLGINIDVAIQPDSTYKKTASFDISLFTWNGGSSPSGFIDDIFNVITGQRPYLAGYYENEELQALLDSAVGVTDPEEVARIYQEAEEFLIRDGAVMPVYWADFQYFQQNYVEGIEYKTFGDAVIDWTYAYILAH